MDAKKIIGIPLLIGVVAIFIWMLFPPTNELGEKFEAKVQAPELIKANPVKSINLYVDFSGSMRGYIDFAGIESGKNTFIRTVSSMLDNLESEYKVTSVSKCGKDTYAKDPLRLAMQNKKIFNDVTTSIQNMVHEAKANANDSSLSIVVSDMVMSWGKAKIIESKDTFYNKTQIDGLGAAIHSEMKAIKDAGLDVMMVQYYSDFNGRYYYNYTENIKASDLYKGKKMEKRPFYIFFVGKADLLKDLVYKNCIKEYENIYTSFNIDVCSKTVNYELAAKEGDDYAKLWNIGNAENEESTAIGGIWTADDLGSSTSSFTIRCNDLIVPPSCYTTHTKLFAESTPDVFSTSSVIYPDFNLHFTLKPYNELESGEVEVRVMCNNNWSEDASTLDDINESKMDGKTWGFESIIKNIDKAFYPNGRDYNQIVGTFKFGIQKNN